ncbi:hypothetical protein E2F43_07690 [Seongchinamella unica]|uniref:Transmembrane protein (PGPGW) n=1 Tax=Seongchinamella unica TaxID=2547392 RepID=A0A4R5LRJ3_9GAMM|nr:PGPGW domain-containing protein [Seongchinamella unica]TDG13416.1 hypothetical protein E2F43_07690 [Seongchinamella unica]
MAWLEQWLPDILLWGTVVSLLSLLALLITAPWVVSRLPQDYFSSRHRHPLQRSNGIFGWGLSLLKNLLGSLLVTLGFIMLFTPGQGILVTVVGLLIMNFPGKYRLERALVSRQSVLNGLNWLRRKQSLPPFEAPRPRAEASD